MKILRTIKKHGEFKSLYEDDTVNTLIYQLEPFRPGWELIGLCRVEEEGYHFLGCLVNGIYLVSVFGKEHEPNLQSDDEENERSQINAGKTSIILFYGTDNHSVMRRLYPEHYVKGELTGYRYNPTDLFYNS